MVVAAALLLAPAAYAAPEVVTGAATDVTEESAVLHGTVNPAGQPTSYTFRYNRAGAFAHDTIVHDAGAGTAPVDVTARLGGLLPNTTYFVELVAVQGSTEFDGASVQFVTPGERAKDLCVVPKLVGVTYFRALRRIVGTGCMIGRPRIARGTHCPLFGLCRPSLLVLRQRPRAGTVLPKGSKVSVLLGRKRRR